MKHLIRDGIVYVKMILHGFNVLVRRCVLICGQGCKVSLQRCATSLRLCEGSPPWLCILCRRTYSSSKAFPHVPTCLYCGVALGPCHPPVFLSWPAMQ